ncbi:MAG: LPS export ABC transporter permease LptF [Nitrospirota bacterium]
MFMGKILDRYIMRELLPPFFLSIAVLTLALFLQKMFRLMEIILSKGTPLAETGKLLLYIMPGFLAMTIPMSLLVAALTAFTRLSGDSEVTAMKASRVSLYAMVRPVLQLSVVLFFVTSAITHFLAPHANFAFKAQLFNMLKARAMVGLEQGVFSSSFDGMVIYVDKMNSLDDIQGIFISDERSGNEPFTIVAKQGRLIADTQNMNVTLAMDRGAIHFQPRTEGVYPLMSFDRGKIFIDISRATMRRRSDDAGRNNEELDSLQLLQEMRQARAGGEPTTAIEIEIQKRISISYACLVFGLIGAPLGIRKSRTGRSAGIAISIFVILVYYLVLGTAARLADSGAVSPTMATWIPNGLITLAAVVMVVKKGNEIYFGIAPRVSGLMRRLASLLRKDRGTP